MTRIDAKTRIGSGMVDDYFQLGPHGHPVTTTSPEAQAWFDRGLVWRYAFNHEAAIDCFGRAAQHDPECAMAYWGIAYASGPYYNKPWEDFTDDDVAETLEVAYNAVRKATALASHTDPVEQALIRALSQRYPSASPPDRSVLHAWEDAYAEAMRTVYAEHGDDPDVAALFAEALMNRTPWQLWDLETGEPAQGADTIEAVGVLENALESMNGRGSMDGRGGPPNPGVLHLYVHAMEMSPHPERALRAADGLRACAPDAGHFLHMPSHIDILCGDYHAALVANERAIEADRRYLERVGPDNFYTLSRCHDYHFKLYAAMFLGQYRPALDAATEMVSTIPERLLRDARPPMVDWLEGFVPMKAHVMVRFGRWEEILAEPVPDDVELYAVTTATLHYAKGVAHAVLGKVAEAESELGLFLDALSRLPETRRFFNNRYVDILAIAREMLTGEIHYRKGDLESAFAHLRTAVALNDGLPYDEPWGWMQPPRHALGALLLEQDRVEEAYEIYRVDLGLDSGRHSRSASHPDNVWGLVGYVECLHRLGRHADAGALQPRLDIALARADPGVRHSCFCRHE